MLVFERIKRIVGSRGGRVDLKFGSLHASRLVLWQISNPEPLKGKMSPIFSNSLISQKSYTH